MSASLDPIACALFLVAAFVIAGVAQTIWLGSAAARRFAQPIDAGRTLRGRRILGPNKTIKGFVMMVPVAAVSFALLAAIAQSRHVAGLWLMPPVSYAAMGAWAGFGYMAGELPNSFIKRQLDVDAGSAARGRVAAFVFFVLDRVDSMIGMMALTSLLVPVPARTWLYVALIGPILHSCFSVAVFHRGGKARAA